MTDKPSIADRRFRTKTQQITYWLMNNPGVSEYDISEILIGDMGFKSGTVNSVMYRLIKKGKLTYERCDVEGFCGEIVRGYRYYLEGSVEHVLNKHQNEEVISDV